MQTQTQMKNKLGFVADTQHAYMPWMLNHEISVSFTNTEPIIEKYSLALSNLCSLTVPSDCWRGRSYLQMKLQTSVFWLILDKYLALSKQIKRATQLPR